MLNIPLGSDEFREFRDGNALYVDKTLLIKELIDDGAKVLLITRPRGFGKSLNMTMIKTFFEKTDEDQSNFFKDLKIWKTGKEYQKELGRYPVIYMSLKEVSYTSWEQCFDGIKDKIKKAYEPHLKIKESLSPTEQIYYDRVLSKEVEVVEAAYSLEKLTHWLEAYYKEKVMVLIDEHDAPVNAGYIAGYQKEIIDFIQSFFGSVMKSNASLKKGIIMGVTQISNLSFFSSFNNYVSETVFNNKYSEYFGFNEKETKEVMAICAVSHDFLKIKAWYDGYTFGHSHDIYNPRSIMNVLCDLTKPLQSYWINSGTNMRMLKDALAKASPEIKEIIYEMIKGKKECLPVVENVTYDNLLTISDGIWSFLLYAGYLTAENVFNDAGDRSAEFHMPNEEVKGAMKKMIASWLLDYCGGISGVNVMLIAMLNGNQENFKERLSYYVQDSFSYFDKSNYKPELVYHAFLLGLLAHLEKNYYFNSKSIPGERRADVLIMPKAGNFSKNAVILEFKKAWKKEELATKAKVALAQINTKGYVDEAKKRGAEIIYCYGIGFFKEEMMMKMVVKNGSDEKS